MIEQLSGLEILDSRGRPTVMATCLFENGHKGTASVPSGASTGKAEVCELRDRDKNRYEGLGCRKAVNNINTVIHKEISGKEFESQSAFDNALIHLDGTENKRNLGANAILACSLAFARAMAQTRNLPLYKYFGGLINNQLFQLPRPTINLFSGGKHAGGQISVQDLLLVPISAHTMDDALEQVYAVYQSASRLIKKKYSMRALTADEGGLAPSFENIEQMLDDAIAAIEQAGLRPDEDIALALDVASSHFYSTGKYYVDNVALDSAGMVDLINSWVRAYPIKSIEDGLAEDDWHFWPRLKLTIQDKCLVLGDDLLCTQVKRIQKAIDTGAANALLLKVNQCGTITEAAKACQLAAQHGWQVTVSARSGETEDDWLADLAVGWNGNQIKIGSITQSERLSKYNRLLALEAYDRLPLRKWTC